MKRDRAGCEAHRAGGILALATALILGTPSTLHPQSELDVRERLESILLLRGKGERERAFTELRELVSEHPGFHSAYERLVDEYLSRDESREAEHYFVALLSDNPENAYAQYALGRVYFDRQDYDRAIEHLKRCIDLDPTFAEAYGYKGGLPEAYHRKGELEASIRFFTDLIETDPGSSRAYYGLGRSHIRQYEWEEGIAAFSRAVELDPGFVLAYHSLAYSHFSISNHFEVVEVSHRLYEAAEEAGHFEMMSYARTMRGNALYYLGDYGPALREFSESLQIAQRVGDKLRELNALNGIGVVYNSSGNNAKALECYNEALRLVREVGDPAVEMRTYNNIAMTLEDLGNLDETLSYYERSWDLARQLGYRVEESIVLTNIAETYEKLGDLDCAMELNRQALDTVRETGDRAQRGYTLEALASLSLKRGNLESAVDQFRQALAVGQEVQDMQILWQSRVGLGAALERQGKTAEALENYAEAIALFDALRTRLGIESLSTGFLEKRYEAYPAIVQLLSSMGRVEEAFAYAEGYKSKTLLEILSRARSVVERLLPKDLRTEIQEVGSRLEAAHRELALELSNPEESRHHVSSLNQRVTELELEKASVDERIQKEYGAYYDLNYAEPLNVEEVQSRILEPNQVLVEYLVGPEKLSIFVVTRGEVRYHDVPISREELIEKLAALSHIFREESGSDDTAGDPIFNPQVADFSLPPAVALYDVLIEPVESWLPTDAELIIVPDDVLFYLPFEVLVTHSPDATGRYDFDQATFLLEKHAIAYAPSASLLDPRLQRPRSAEKGLLAWGNPDFAGDEEGESNEWVTTSAAARGAARDGRLLPLPNAEAEVRAIGKLLAGSLNRVYTGKEATEAVFKKEAQDYRILHFATHFLSNDIQPLYSTIVLARRDEEGDDGYLQIHEVFNARLNADLVVLSACNTGVGKLRKGEGLVGATRAFLYAGAPSLLVSLWSVDDEATSMIMTRFYEGLKAGLNKRQALRQAKLEYVKSAEGPEKDPFYWGPFNWLGDGSPRSFEPGSGFSPAAWGGMLVAFVAILIVMARVRRGRRSA